MNLVTESGAWDVAASRTPVNHQCIVSHAPLAHCDRVLWVGINTQQAYGVSFDCAYHWWISHRKGVCVYTGRSLPPAQLQSIRRMLVLFGEHDSAASARVPEWLSAVSYRSALVSAADVRTAVLLHTLFLLGMLYLLYPSKTFSVWHSAARFVLVELLCQGVHGVVAYLVRAWYAARVSYMRHVVVRQEREGGKYPYNLPLSTGEELDALLRSGCL